MKRFSTVRDTQRCSQSNMKRRGRKEIEVSRRRKRRTQEERDQSTQYSVPIVFSIAQNNQRDSLNWSQKRRGREEKEVILGEKKACQKGERVIITLLSKNGH